MRQSSSHAVTSPASSATQSVEPLAVDYRAAARLLGVSSRTIFSMVHDGRLASFTIGRRRLIARKAISDFIESQSIGGAK